MPLRPLRLRSHDVAVALQLVLTPESSYPDLAGAVGVSLGESHNAVGRLAAARLVLPGTRTVAKRPLMDFLLHGVPYAFPASLGPRAQGVPTSGSGPAFRGGTASPAPARPRRPAPSSPIVWPCASGTDHGASLAPMCARAPDMVESNPALYRWLTLVDVLRLGDPGQTRAAERILRKEMHGGSIGAPSEK